VHGTTSNGDEDDITTTSTSGSDTDRKMPWPLNMFNAPVVLDGTLAGDAGFDPLGLARSKDDLFFYREAEVKHARIAMLASVGWPSSELYHYQISQSVGLEDILAEGGRAPSVLNGGLDNVFALFALGLFFAVGSVLEVEMARTRRAAPAALRNFFDMWRDDGWDLPGNYGFDPLRLGVLLCPSAADKLLMQSAEILSGRTAMLATVGFVVQEYVTGLPVVRETPQFFYFLGQSM